MVDGVLVHLGGHSRVVNTAYGLGDESGAVELEGGCAQGAPGSPSIYNWTVAPARAYAEAGLPGYELLSLSPGRGDEGEEAGTSRGTLPQYADDDALMNGGQAEGGKGAEAVAEELREAAERLAMGYAVAGVRNRHQKCILDMSPVRGRETARRGVPAPYSGARRGGKAREMQRHDGLPQGSERGKGTRDVQGVGPLPRGPS